MGKLGRAIGAALAVTWSCGAPAAGPATPDPGATTRRYAPLTIKADAKNRLQAVILGTDATNGSTVLPLAAAPGRAVVDAMVVRLDAAGATGSSTPVTLSTEPSDDGAVRVGVYEELVGGAGSQWRAGVWISAFVAASTLGKDLTDYSFSAASRGTLDGASASGLMAGGFLATITGARIDPTATMTGTINPDGTIGPVAGIPEKFLGAIAAGKRTLGYPIGTRWARSEATGKDVDLVALARDRGATAVEVATVHDAYALLTGARLPQPVPLAEREMALDAATIARLKTAYARWQQRLAGEWAALLQLQQAGRLPVRLAAMARRAQAEAERAEALHRRGLVAGAYTRMLTAWVYAASATSTYDVIAKLQAGDAAGAVAELASLDELDQRTAAVFEKIGALRPATLGGYLVMLSSFQAALRSWGFKVFAREAVGDARALIASLGGRPPRELQTPEVADAIVERVAPTVLLIGQTVAATAMAADELEIMSDPSIAYACSAASLERMATSFRSAGAAGVAYFEALLVEPAAKQAGVTLDQARVRVALAEPTYLVAYVLARLPQVDGLPAQLRQAWGERSPQWSLMSLAASQLAYYGAADLIARYHALGVKPDEVTGRTRGLEHEKAFIAMLASAERSARASARAARIATGAVPVQAKLAYQQATIARDGDLDDKLEALSQFWMASAYAQTAVMLARN